MTVMPFLIQLLSIKGLLAVVSVMTTCESSAAVLASPVGTISTL